MIHNISIFNIILFVYDVIVYLQSENKTFNIYFIILYININDKSSSNRQLVW